MLLPQAASALEVFACEPEWGSLVTELAGEHASVTVATTAFQDPHRLQAKPSLIAAIRKADLVVCTGADLEIGWLPLLLRRGGSAPVFYSYPLTSDPGWTRQGEWAFGQPTGAGGGQGEGHGPRRGPEAGRWRGLRRD